MTIKYSIIVLTYRRDDVLAEMFQHLSSTITKNIDNCEVILVDNNQDSFDRSIYLKNFNHSQYIKTDKNKGVAGGRNEGIRNAKGDYLLFIDDDAFIYPVNCLDLIVEAFNKFPEVKILAHKSINYYTSTIGKWEFPHPNKNLDPDMEFKTYWFIGVAHSIRKELFDAVGLYEEDFFYSMEEWDLSYRTINKGYNILYYPNVWVYHKKHPEGRLINLKLLEYHLLNKMKVGYMHLPMQYFFINCFLWGIYALYKSNFKVNLFTLIKKFLVWKEASKSKRNVLNKLAIKYVKSCGGNLWRR